MTGDADPQATLSTAGDLTETPAAPRDVLAPGTLLAGRYELGGLLGTGAYAIVYRAYDRELRQTVAVKLLRPERGSPSTLARLRREAAVTRAVASPRLVRIHDLGASPEGNFLSMELVEGQSLKDRLRGGPLPLAQAIEIATQVLEGLGALHERGFVHRDVKPGNILLSDTGARLADFGLARSLDLEETRATMADSLLGTAEYMAPEQALNRAVDARTDLYAVGVVLYEMVAGRLPFPATSSMATILARLHSPAPPVRLVAPHAPAWLSALISRLLEPTPSMRYPSAAAVLHDLASSRGPFWTRRRRRSTFAAGLVLLALVAIAGLRILDGRNSRFDHLAPLGPGSFDGIAAIARNGKPLWTIADVGTAPRHSALVRTAPEAPPLLATILTKQDELFPEHTRVLTFLDPETGAVHSREALPPGEPLFSGASDTFTVHAIHPLDLNADGVDEILIDFLHLPNIPAYTVLYEPRLRRARVVYVSDGHHYFAAAQDLDGDGHEELLFSGPSNPLGWYATLAAVRLEPWVDEAPAVNSFAYAESPDRFQSAAPTQGALLWYTLLPSGELGDRSRETIGVDPARRRVLVRYGDRSDLELDFYGFAAGPADDPDPKLRNQRRMEAYGHRQEALRLAAAGEAHAALAECDRAEAKAREAGEERLLECMRRGRAKVLAGLGRVQEAHLLFTELAENPEQTSNIAYEAGEALHLAGAPEFAASWYSRGIGRGGKFGFGRSKDDFLEGIVLALGELGRWDDALAEADRFQAVYSSGRNLDVGATAAHRSYILWRSGRPLPPVDPRMARRGIDDVRHYLPLEFELARGGDPEQLLVRARQELRYATRTKGHLWMLQGELLARLGRHAEAVDAARLGAQMLRDESKNEVLARALVGLAEERLEKIAGAGA